MTHSLLVMHMALGCDMEAGDMTIDLDLPFNPIEGVADGIVVKVLGRIAIGGAVEHEDVGVESFDGETAEAGLATALEEPWLTVVVIESALDDPTCAFPGTKSGSGSVMTIAAMLVGVSVNRWGFVRSTAEYFNLAKFSACVSNAPLRVCNRRGSNDAALQSDTRQHQVLNITRQMPMVVEWTGFVNVDDVAECLVTPHP